MERAKYEQLMYDIWYDELINDAYQIGTGEMSAMTGKAGYVEFHIALVKKAYEGEESEEVFKRIWEDKTQTNGTR